MSAVGRQAPGHTLPAPGVPLDAGALLAEVERLSRDNKVLAARLTSQEATIRDAALVLEEVVRLRSEVAQLRSRSERPRVSDVAPARLPPPSPVPRGLDFPLYASHAVPTGAPVEAAPSPGMGLDFGAVSRLNPAELDQLPYGLICLDAQGRVVHYNDTESRLARLPKESVIGRNFFQDVAPCTRVREFEGEFYELVRDPSRVRVRSFDFVFRFRHGEQHVTIVLTPARQRGLYNMALLRRSVRPA